jgi:hypothetical protein
MDSTGWDAKAQTVSRGKSAASAPTYRLILKPIPNPADPGGIRRLRAILKRALRAYGLRCVSCVEIRPDAG